MKTLEEVHSEAMEAIVAQSKNPEETKKVLDDLLSAQKQMDIVPTELDIPVRDVIRRYPVSGPWEIVRCKGAIFFHAAGMWLVSRPTVANNGNGGALYETLEMVCDYYDEADKFTEEEKRNIEVFISLVVQVLSLPLDVFCDETFTFAVANDILERRTELYQRISDLASQVREDTEEDIRRNLEFEEAVTTVEAIRKEAGNE